MNFRRHGDNGARARRMRKGMYILPSMFTTANLAAGFYAILQCLQASVNNDYVHFNYAAMAIGFAVFFDGMDGTIARLTNTTSDFGKELDSLADVVTFGVAPAVLAYTWGFRMLPNPETDLQTKLVQFGAIVCFIFVAAGASRLARFNIQLNPQPSNPGRPGRKYFVGMPIPAGAGCIAAIVHFALGEPIKVWWLGAIWLSFVVSLAFLMVSTWRFWSAKSIDFRSRHPFRLILIIGIIIAAIWFYSRYVLFIMALVYMLSGVLARFFYAIRRRPVVAPPNEVSDI